MRRFRLAYRSPFGLADIADPNRQGEKDIPEAEVAREYACQRGSISRNGENLLGRHAAMGEEERAEDMHWAQLGLGYLLWVPRVCMESHASGRLCVSWVRRGLASR